MVLGLTASTAANVLHAVDLDKGGQPAIIGAAFWPLALLCATETLTRKRWPARVRPWAVMAVVVVALVTAVVSYGHLHALLESWGAGPFEAAIAPAAVDGLMTVCSLALTVPDAPPDPGPWWSPASPASPGSAAAPLEEPPAPRARAPRTGGRAVARPGRPAPDVTELVPVARAIAQELGDVPLTRSALQGAFRARGQSLSTDRARALLAIVRP
jgi:hypothetical protein